MRHNNEVDQGRRPYCGFLLSNQGRIPHIQTHSIYCASYHFVKGLRARIPLCCIWFYVKKTWQGGVTACRLGLIQGCVYRSGCKYTHCDKCVKKYHV